MADDRNFRNCGSCKKPIALGQKYYACSISTCKKAAYCSMPCFDEHSPVFRHKDAWAEERKAPMSLEIDEPLANRFTTTRLAPSPSNLQKSSAPHEILIVGSKLKDYIRHKAGLNTSAAVLDRLSDMVRVLCDNAIEQAMQDNRKTVMDRDFSF